MTPKHGDHETRLLKDLMAQVIVNLTEADLPAAARISAMNVVMETARQFIYERPRPTLRIVR